MDKHNYDSHLDPWERDSYETGSTKCPKSSGGIVAVLLVLVILLVGLSSALGILNIKLTQQNNQKPDGPVAFHPNSSDPTVSDLDPTGESTPSVPTPEKNQQLPLATSPESVENIPQTGGLSLQQIYEKAIDSVVSITCRGNDGGSSGTGVVLHKNGYIVTNSHVVDDASTIQVQLTDQRVFNAVLVGEDEISDLAVLYVQAEDLTPAQFGDSNALRVGDAVAAIGDPLGSQLRGTMTDGIVSAINREVKISGRPMTLIQTNAALNSGNSGGPLLNCYGQVIGINTMKISAFADSSGVEGLGFAIPSTTVKEIVDQLIAQGYVSGRPSLGIRGEAVSDAYQFYYHLPAGFYINHVPSGGSAEKAGLTAGDIILSLGGQRIEDEEDLTEALYSHQPGDQVEITIYRNHQQYTGTVTLGQFGE